MINLTIDGQSISVEKGVTVYQAAQKLGIEIPVFCYQDRMPPFGACRVCLVEVEKMGKLQASCTLEAKEGMVVSTQSARSLDGRKSIVEFLLLNHPLDCPICDKGGECPLQEHALNHGPGESRFFEEKRHFKKPLPLGPVLMLDRERCIVCARCTRFGAEIAGDHALEFVERGYRTEVGTPGNRPAESKFIGNTIKICPVGALTSQVYRFRARPWDNEATDSTCTLCPAGCSLIIDSRDGEVMRTRSRENPEINDIWLCDKGWFGYEFTASEKRLQKPLIAGKEASWDEAFSLIAEKIKTSQTLAGWGGCPLTVEENDLFQQLYPNTDYRIGWAETSEKRAVGMQTPIKECEQLKAAYLLGLDLTEEFPVIWLRLRQAINKGAKVVFIGHKAPEIAPYLSEVILHRPGEELEHIEKYVKKGEGAIFVGSQYLNTPARDTILAELLKLQRPVNIMEGRGNSRGAEAAGMRKGLSARQVLKKESWDFLHVAGADPAAVFSSKLWQRQKIGFLVVTDLFLTETAKQADVVLPTLSYFEKGGTFINIEGRAEKLLPGKRIPEGLYSDGEIFVEIGKRLGHSLSVDRTFSSLKNEIPPIDPAAYPPFVGDLRATFCPVLFDRGNRMRHNPHVSGLVKEPKVRLHPAEGKKRGLKEGISVKVKAQGSFTAPFIAPLAFDDGVALGTLAIPLGFPELGVQELSENLFNGLAVEVQPC